jgi:hypothetical protein
MAADYFCFYAADLSPGQRQLHLQQIMVQAG